MQRGPELLFDMVKSAACPSAPCMKESKQKGIRGGPEGRRNHLVLCFFNLLDIRTQAKTSIPSRTSFTNNLLVIYFDPHTHRQKGKKAETSKAIRDLIYLWIHSLPTEPFSILRVMAKKSLSEQQLKGHYLFIRQRINKNSSIYIFERKMLQQVNLHSEVNLHLISKQVLRKDCFPSLPFKCLSALSFSAGQKNISLFTARMHEREYKFTHSRNESLRC